jgi:hypothetical protein
VPFNIYDGSSWNPLKKLKIHDGSTWQDAKAIYVFDGTQWKKTGSKPTNTVLPSFTTDSRDTTVYSLEPGKTLTLVQGTWTDMDGSSTSWAYEWQKRKIGTSSWETISGQTGLTLLLNENLWPTQLKYVGYQIRCKVTATNQFGPNDPLTPIYTPETGFVLPASLTSVSATVTSNDIVEFTWQKPVGANDFYVQYQGPDVTFTEIASLVSNTDASKGVYTVNGSSAKLVIDLGSADGTLGSLFNPKFTEGSYSLTGYGTNANVSDLKIAKASVTSSKSNISTTGFTFSWQLNNGITPTSWTIYDGASVVDTSYLNGVNSTSYVVSKIVTGGTTYGDYWIKVYGSAPRHKATNWESTPRLSVTAPQTPVPVNTAAPVISGGGRVFTSTTGSWTNTGSVYYYIYNWYANGSLISIPSSSTLDLGTTTQYDNATITCKVYCFLTDLNSTPESPSSNSLTASPYIQYYNVYVTCNSSTMAYSGAYGTPPTGANLTSNTGSVTSNTLTSAQIVSTLGIPSACVPPANPTIYYAYCNGTSATGVLSSNSYASCAAANTALSSSISSGWSCFTNSGSVVNPNCAAPPVTWYCTTSSPGAGVGNCGYTTSATNTSGSGSGYSTACLTSGYPACQSTAAPTTYPTLLSGYHSCTSQDVANPSSPCTTVGACLNNSASGAACSTSKPSCPGTITNANAYTCAELGREYLGSSGTYNIASNQQCCGETIQPVFSPPTFTPVFTPPTFTPDPPDVFTPPTFFAPPAFWCIDEDTLIQIVGPDNSISFKKAKDITLDEEVWSVTWNGQENEFTVDPYTWSSESIENITNVKTRIKSIKSSVKDATIIINENPDQRFSLEQTVLAKKQGKYFFSTTGILEPGDSVFMRNEDNLFVEVLVDSTRIIDEQRTVYQFDAAPNDIIIAGGLSGIILHNAKGF